MAEIDASELGPQLTQLLDSLSAGESLTIMRSGHAVARLVAVEGVPPQRKGPRQPGGLEHVKLPDEFFDPLSEEELALWE